jgi:hypothetical protein
MADLKISQFTDGGLVQDTDYVPAVRAGNNVKVLFGDAAAGDIGVDVQAYSAKLAAATALSGDIVGTTDSQTLTNKTINHNVNTITNPYYFRVRLSANQTPVSGTDTTVAFNTEDADPSNIFDTTTHRVTPNRAGKWLMSCTLGIVAGSLNNNFLRIVKNSNTGYLCAANNAVTAGYNGTIVLTTIVEANGTTDWFAMRAQLFMASPTILGDTLNSHWTGIYLGA